MFHLSSAENFVSVITQRLREYVRLTRLDRPIGIYLVMWPMLWALWVAGEGRPDPLVFVVFMLGTVLMRSAGCAINDYADRHIDLHVSRTKQRPLAVGTIRPREAVWVFVVLSLLAFGLVLLMNPLTIQLSVIGVLLAASYPFTKRYTYLPQAYLGVAFGWAIPMAFAAQANALPPVVWLLFMANVLWSLSYDTMYAMADRADDLKIGVKSSAILFGRYDRLIIGVMQVVMFGLFVLAGLSLAMSLWYYLGLLVAAGCAIYEQYLIRRREPSQCFRAFLNNHYLGASIFVGIALHYLLT
ncbi:MAG: 4-hydroxybenzoate octaprenyltransferase [Thiohalomonadaceae bacterium]